MTNSNPTTMNSSHSSDCKLIWITPNAEEMIAYLARVSNPNNQNNTATADKLIRYLIKHLHWSPFEMASMCVEINTTRAISAQILRHRSMKFQEFSLRYSDVGVLGSPSLPHLRRQDNKNRQNSIDDLPAQAKEAYYRRIASLYEDIGHLYMEMVSNGVAKECAREILPLGSPTRLYMKGDIRSFLFYTAVRSGPETQLEHRKIALEIKDIIKREMPVIHNAFFEKE